MTDDPTFEPRDGSPTIHVHIRNRRSTQGPSDDNWNKLWSEHAEETEKATYDETTGRLVGETKYDVAPTITYEYDVVKCADFVYEKDCWINNMPAEIKKVNPNFVPT
jgi:hypothetical protein